LPTLANFRLVAFFATFFLAMVFSGVAARFADFLAVARFCGRFFCTGFDFLLVLFLVVVDFFLAFFLVAIGAV